MSCPECGGSGRIVVSKEDDSEGIGFEIPCLCKEAGRMKLPQLFNIGDIVKIYDFEPRVRIIRFYGADPRVAILEIIDEHGQPTGSETECPEFELRPCTE